MLLKLSHASVICFWLSLTILLPWREATAQAPELHLRWKPREDLNILLPRSVRVHEANGVLSDNAPLRVHCTTIDLRDTNLRLRAVGSNSLRETTLETYTRYRAIFAVNAGYFSARKSESILISDGELIAPGPTRYTRGAFAITDGKPQVVWPFADSASSRFQLANPTDVQENPKALRASSTLSWYPAQATGAGPVLMKNGKIRDTSIEEGFAGSHLLRHPRTAIGYKDDHTLVVVVVDGRQQASAGATIKELAQLMSELGCYEAVNLDGGGSSAMVAANEVVNIPVDVPNGNRNSLRKNASSWILTEEFPSVHSEFFTFDTDNDQYTAEGIWRKSNLVNYYGNSPSQEALSNATNKAVYHLGNLRADAFQVAAWWPVNESNTSDAVYIVHHRKGIDSIHVNQTSLLTSGKWNVLGEYFLSGNDYIEVVGRKPGKLQTDAIRLVMRGDIRNQPLRGDLRIAVISDLNSGLGSAQYEWQVDSIVQRLPRGWQPDLVVCGGDMVAGMGVRDTAVISRMWEGFDEHIAMPLRSRRIPFAFTIGNHDGLRSLPVEREALARYWSDPAHSTGLDFIDRSHFPHYYSFRAGDCFFVSWDASSSEITSDNLTWLVAQLQSDEARKAKARFVMGHLPLFSVAQERDAKGDQLMHGDSLRRILEKYDVGTYISGHQHAYYPGKRGKLQLLNAGAAGSGPRRWLSTDRDPVNTVTIMDIFYEPDTVVFTTYDIKHRLSKDMTLFDHHDLPAYIPGENGFVVREDVHVGELAAGKFNAMNDAVLTPSMGTTTVKYSEHQLQLSGQATLPSKSRARNVTVGLYQGRHTEDGVLIGKLPVTLHKRGSATFDGRISAPDGATEMLSAGGYYVMLRSESGDFRAQLYPPGNHAPLRPIIDSHQSGNVYGIRNIKGLYRFSWTRADDEDGDFVSYTYQLASDSLFRNLLVDKSSERVTHLKIPESFLYGLIGSTSTLPVTKLYHRVVATDGLHATVSTPVAIKFIQSQEPLSDLAEVDPPSIKFEGKITEASGQGSGALWDKNGKLWMADYGGTLYVHDPDGKNAAFSPLRSVKVNGHSYPLKPINGMSLDNDGNVLLGCNRVLLKVDAATGEGIAAWEVPEGKRAITTPRVNAKGEIYAMSLFAEDPNYVLKQSSVTPGTFDLVRMISMPQRILARTFEIQNDGLTLLFPDPGSPVIQTFSSKDGVVYTKGKDITSVSAGTNAIASRGSSLFATVRASGVSGSTLHMRDEANQEMWTAELSELHGAEARGMAVSPDGKTIVICVWDKGGGFYRYRIGK